MALVVSGSKDEPTNPLRFITRESVPAEAQAASAPSPQSETGVDAGPTQPGRNSAAIGREIGPHRHVRPTHHRT